VLLLLLLCGYVIIIVNAIVRFMPMSNFYYRIVTTYCYWAVFLTRRPHVAVVGCLFLAVTVTISCLAVHEEQFIPPRDAQGNRAPWTKIFVDIWQALKSFPSRVRRVFVVQCFTWFGWFTGYIYLATWMGEQVYNGDPSADKHTTPRNDYEVRRCRAA